jgi:membrane protein DedA with SNARE-associated domain
VLGSVSDLITEQIARNGYLAVFLLMLLGSACIPIPSEVVMLFGGALASSAFAASALGAPGEQLGLAAVVFVGIVGSLIGSWLAYWAGAVGGRPLIDRWGRYLLLRPHEVDRAHEWFERHGQGTVFFARLIPLVRAFISLPAGVARMSFGRFTLYTLLGITPWTVGLTLAGYGLGANWTKVERAIRPFSWALAALAVMAVGWWVWTRVRDLRAHPVPSGTSEDPAREEPVGR